MTLNNIEELNNLDLKKLCYEDLIRCLYHFMPESLAFDHRTRLMVTYVDDNSVADQQVYITKPKTREIEASYLTGLLGSQVIGFYIRNFYDELEALFPQIKVSQLKELPIPINYQELQKSISEIVTPILGLKKANLEAGISALEAEIDQLVYELYDLTEDEIKIVGENVK